jgi:hypothetical protein
MVSMVVVAVVAVVVAVVVLHSQRLRVQKQWVEMIYNIVPVVVVPHAR